jgi:hypothetical protein
MSSWLKRKIFAPISKLNDFYDYKDGEKTLIVPDIDWNHMSLFDASDYINILVQLSTGENKQVPQQTLYRSLGLEYEEERRKLRKEDIYDAIRTKELQSLGLNIVHVDAVSYNEKAENKEEIASEEIKQEVQELQDELKTIDVSASSSGMTRALNLCYRNFDSYKYIYTSNESNTLIQIDVTNIDSCSVTTFLLNFKTVIWGIAVDNQNDKLYVADPFNNNGVSEGIHQIAFSKNATTGIITAITGNTFLIRNASTTSITDGELSTSQLVASLGIHYSSDTNDLYVASKDGKISKLHKLFSSINNKSY